MCVFKNCLTVGQKELKLVQVCKIAFVINTIIRKDNLCGLQLIKLCVNMLNPGLNASRYRMSSAL